MISLREIIIRLNNRFIDWVIHRHLRREKDPQRCFEIKLWMEMSGVTLGGQAADGAWATYKQYYYDKLPTEYEKNKVRNALLSMLKSNDYDISKKAILAHVCADLGIEDALQDVNDLLRQAQKSSDKKTLQLAYEALSRGIPVYELVDEKFRKGERM